jgi:hypothetical protein
MGVLTKDELFRRAPSDIVTDTIDVPEWLSDEERELLEQEKPVDMPQVRVKSLTSGQQAVITKLCVKFGDGSVDLDVPRLQRMQVMDGLVEPLLTAKEVERFQQQSGAGFQRVLNWITDKSGFDEDKAKDAVRRFQVAADGPDEAPAEDAGGEGDLADAR